MRTMLRYVLKMRRLRKNVKGWNKNVEGEYRKTKTEVSNRIDEIDKYAETHGLSTQAFEERKI